MKVCEIVNAFEGEGILVSNAKAAVNDSNVAKLLAEIHRDYQVLPKMIPKRVRSTLLKKYTLTSQLST